MPFTRTALKYDAYLSPNEGKAIGRIILYASDMVLKIIFVDPSVSTPPNSYDTATKTGIAYQPIGQYINFMDMLRNEKPIYVSFAPEVTPPTFEVYCQSEPTGENE
jgi:hypothetical protein